MIVPIFTPPYTLPHPFPPPTLETTPFGFIYVSFIHVPWWPPHYLLLSLSLLSGYCQIVLYFNVSGCILLAWNLIFLDLIHSFHVLFHAAVVSTKFLVTPIKLLVVITELMCTLINIILNSMYDRLPQIHLTLFLGIHSFLSMEGYFFVSPF